LKIKIILFIIISLLIYKANSAGINENLEIKSLVEKSKNTFVLDEKIEILNKVIEIDKDNIEAHRTLGLCYFRKKNYIKSDYHLNLAVELKTKKFVNEKKTGEEIIKPAVEKKDSQTPPENLLDCLNTGSSKRISERLLITGFEASLIVKYREKYGLFKSADELKQIPILNAKIDLIKQ